MILTQYLEESPKHRPTEHTKDITVEYIQELIS